MIKIDDFSLHADTGVQSDAGKQHNGGAQSDDSAQLDADSPSATPQPIFPFTAIVGQKDMLRALCLAAVEPRIGGVLILGERGTAKTTAVRALAQVMPGNRRVVELPLNASEDRVVGNIQVDTLMQSGKRVFEPGLLGEANGQILYVDEINLLDDSIVDVLLDSAASGVCHVEREGISRTFPARFVLVGTMNPEEGSLRPQLLDRFGLSVAVRAQLSADERLELVERHIAFENDSASFVSSYAAANKQLQDQLALAQELYLHVAYSHDMARLAASIIVKVGVDGYRADITMMRCARVLAALAGRGDVLSSDVLEAARYVLPHRVKRQPFETEQLAAQDIAKLAQEQFDQLQLNGRSSLNDDTKKNVDVGVDTNKFTDSKKNVDVGVDINTDADSGDASPKAMARRP